MQDWIALDGVRSDTLSGLVVMDYTDLYLAARSRETTAVAGRLTAIRQKAWKREPQPVTVTLALVGADEAAVDALWRESVRPWLYGATRLTLSHRPTMCYLGDVTGVVQSEDEDRWITLTLTFTCNPACPVRLLTPATGWWPTADTPIPKQITEANATAQGTFTSDGFLTAASYAGMEAGACFFVVTGTWTTLKLGADFEILQAATAQTTLYIDGENAQVWVEDAGAEVNRMGVCTGELPTVTRDAPTVSISGTGLNVNIKMLVMEYA